MADLVEEIEADRLSGKMGNLADEIRYYLEMLYSEKIKMKELVESPDEDFSRTLWRDANTFLNRKKMKKAASLLIVIGYPVNLITQRN